MKASKETVIKISEQILHVLNHFGLDIELLNNSSATSMWRMWHWIHEEISYSEDHPRFEGRERIFEHDFNHELYPDDTNDKTMTTALRDAFKLAYDKTRNTTVGS